MYTRNLNYHVLNAGRYLSCVATPRERVWDMAIEQFIATHCGVRRLDIKCYNPFIQQFLEIVIGSAVHWLFEVIWC